MFEHRTSYLPAHCPLPVRLCGHSSPQTHPSSRLSEARGIALLLPQVLLLLLIPLSISERLVRTTILTFNALFTLPDTDVATEIVARVAGGEWTSSEVLEAYIVRAVSAHLETNCLTEGMCPCALASLVDMYNIPADSLQCSLTERESARNPWMKSTRRQESLLGLCMACRCDPLYSS